VYIFTAPGLASCRWRPLSSNVRRHKRPTMDIYHPEKLIWSHQDFATMGWHDARIWSTVADSENFEFLFDLDYIFNWVHPGPGETYFRFWVAPVTMVFENAGDVRIDIDSQQGCIEVADFHLEQIEPSPNGKFTQYRSKFECQEGSIELQSTGFKMYVRRPPTLMSSQSFQLAARNGVSFSRTYSDA
jgi:hypothetical protein